MKKRFSQRIFLKRLEETHKTEEPSPKKETERTEEHSDQKEDLSETCNTFVKEIKKVDKFGKLLKKEMWFETREDNTRRIQMKVYNKKCICFEKLHESIIKKII